jgi:hypothetical protein
MTLLELCGWIEAMPIPTLVRESNLIFPWVESVHVMAMGVVFGGISIIDLRLLGLTSRSRAVTRMSDELLPWIWGAFALSVVTGLLMFSSSATRYYVNIPYRMKLVLLACAGLNMLLFHVITYRGVARWDLDVKPPLTAQIAGAMSILLWAAVIVVGRWIGFTL